MCVKTKSRLEYNIAVDSSRHVFSMWVLFYNSEAESVLLVSLGKLFASLCGVTSDFKIFNKVSICSDEVRSQG